MQFTREIICLFSVMMLHLGTGSSESSSVASTTPNTTTVSSRVTVHQVTQDEININDHIVSPGKTESFQQCMSYLVGTKWVCAFDAGQHYLVEMEQFLTLRAMSQEPEDCCAIWYTEQCVAVKRDTYEACQVKEVLEYFQKVHDTYVGYGCGFYYGNGTLSQMCNNFSAGTGLHTALLIGIVTLLTITVYNL